MAINSQQAEERWGYTIKVKLAQRVDEQICSLLHLDIAYFVYFTEEFNASGNPSTSNPLEIYKALDEAVKYGAARHPKVESLRHGLSRAVVSRLTADRDMWDKAEDLLKEIEEADLNEFQPMSGDFQ